MKHIPNILTLLNLCCGAAAIACLFTNNIDAIFILLGWAFLFDFFDGLIARLLKADSAIGKELDSLADMVSFVTSSFFIVAYLMQNITNDWMLNYILALPLLCCGALRLAIFNLDKGQKEIFKGLPTPAVSIFILGLLAWHQYSPYTLLDALSDHPVFILTSSSILSALMVLPFPLMSLKFNHYEWKGNQPRYLLLIFSIAVLVLYKLAALPFIITFYLIIGTLPIAISKQS